MDGATTAAVAVQNIRLRAEALEAPGMTARVEEAPGTVTIGARNCPLYDGLRMAGVEHATIGAMRRRGVGLGYARLAEALPRLSGRLSPNPAVAAETSCHEPEAATTCKNSGCHPEGDLRSRWNLRTASTEPVVVATELPDLG